MWCQRTEFKHQQAWGSRPSIGFAQFEIRICQGHMHFHEEWNIQTWFFAKSNSRLHASTRFVRAHVEQIVRENHRQKQEHQWQIRESRVCCVITLQTLHARACAWGACWGPIRLNASKSSRIERPAVLFTTHGKQNIVRCCWNTVDCTIIGPIAVFSWIT